MTDEQILERWCELYVHLYLLHKGERLGELRAERAPLLDKRGLHPFSIVFGQMMQLESQLTELTYMELDLAALRRQARADAQAEHRQEIVEEYEREREGRRAA